MANLPKDLQGLVLTESPTSSEKSERKVTKEDLQAIMMAFIKSLERNSQSMERNSQSMKINSRETREDISRLYSLTGNLQRRLDLEYPTPENDHARTMTNEASPVNEAVIPLFPILEEKKDKGKNKEESEASHPVLEEILGTELPNPLFSLNNRGHVG
ncbi:hypothetical protein ACFX1R_049167 [Malus domestica]